MSILGAQAPTAAEAEEGLGSRKSSSFRQPTRVNDIRDMVFYVENETLLKGTHNKQKRAKKMHFSIKERRLMGVKELTRRDSSDPFDASVPSKKEQIFVFLNCSSPLITREVEDVKWLILD
ncbi:hypothetical protein NE237_001587 [Protea cynaroides]|uniref:Uncharacterized protein n=1 Tax=Protea cynaroides TaxID=273540 RepID=A0A9Q0KTM5_9MAGN|nr:hypothetical protein NE237_001587 [Protea cynaroides]